MYVAADTAVASTIPALTIPAASSAAVIVPAAMLLATMVPAWMVDPSSGYATHADPFQAEMTAVAVFTHRSLTSGVAGADGPTVIRFPPTVLTVMPSFSMTGVMPPLAISADSGVVPGALLVTGEPPGICAVSAVPAEYPVSHGDSGTVLNDRVHSDSFSVSEYPQASCFTAPAGIQAGIPVTCR